ncbi:MAG TPA: PAS domain-containing protein [Desulfitobacterium dehalogenans]|uniref:histidine kinase n=1 Tax=Desulfitobacterium dehalogenans TaxID=36854 RepID=A0A7C7D7K3_9FIRM|nr:PAS domain-containing protein [Desulfitobacterium dehalogenans]
MKFHQPLILFFAIVTIGVIIYGYRMQDVGIVVLAIETVLDPAERIQILPTMSIAGMGVFLGISRYRLFPWLPMARAAAIDAIQEGIIIVDEQGRVVDNNIAVDRLIYDIIGVKRNVIGKNIERVLSAWPQWQSACKNVHEDEFEIDLLTWGKARFFRVKVYPLQGYNFRKNGTVSVLTDITNNRIRAQDAAGAEWAEEQVENELELLKQQMETIFSTISDLALLSIVDRNGNYVLYNEAVKPQFVEADADLTIGSAFRKGLYFSACGTEMDYCDIPEIKVLKGEKVSKYPFMMKRKTGETHFLFNGTPIYDKRGNVTYAIFFTLDITDQILRKRLAQVTQNLAELNMTKDKLIQAVIHDIRNPIATLVSLLELVEEKEHDPEYHHLLTTVSEQVKYTYAMVENLLKWFQKQKENVILNPSLINLYRNTQKAIEFYAKRAEGKGIEIKNRIRATMNVYADSDLIEFVLRNLVDNALKYTAKGGTISIQAHSSATDVIVSVTDTGTGIDPANLRTLFKKPTLSTRGTEGEKGSGLGLMLCKEFVQSHGGDIWVESEPGKGSTFSFSLSTSGKSILVGGEE